tara:strand:- start:416 stop:2320 length:1905 start_codon:yes stop_codon:yes gene_type:complete
MEKRINWVMDYETLSNCFIGCFEDTKSEDQKLFVIHESKNDILELVTFLEKNIAYNEWHVSFNGLSFDSQITEHILKNKKQLLKQDGDTIAKFLYSKAQDVIDKQNNGEFSEFSPKDLHIRQLDVFKLNHWDNPAKRSSLKWIQYTMDWHNIIDMPIHHTETIIADQISEIIKYCWNDVKSTKQIMLLSKSNIDLRGKLTEEYGIDLYSASEPRISKELFLHFLSEKTGIKKYDLRQGRTLRTKIVVKDIILPYIEFKTATFQNLLKKFQEVEIYPGETKGGFKYSIRYKGLQTDYGLGGIHGARSSKVYIPEEGMIIMTSDVTSFYPNLAIRNKWAPAHLPQKAFYDLYEWFFEERKKIPKKDPKNYVYKIILNSTYGLSNDKNSFLYDPEFTMKITINGQLSLSMLYEMICEEIPGAIPLMQNTDGLETVIPKDQVDKYMEICARWEELTKLQLEHDKYSKIILGDVNNYIAITEDGKAKCKGRFDFENLALHKNKSFLIIPKAIFNYFVNGIDPKEYLKSQKNIFDYCGGVKIKGDWEFYEHSLVNGNYVKQPLQHTIRYYISHKGSKIIKTNQTDHREIQIEAGKWMQTSMIDYVEKDMEDYDINYDYYLENIEKEINSLEPKITQLKLF